MKGTDHILSADLDDLILLRREADNIVNLMGTEKKNQQKGINYKKISIQ